MSEKEEIKRKRNRRFQILYIIVDVLIVTLSFLLFIWIKPASKSYYLPEYYKPFLSFSCRMADRFYDYRKVPTV